MRPFITFGLGLYITIAGWGPFSGTELPYGWALNVWIAGYLVLLFSISYEFVFNDTPLDPIPFRFIVLGIVMMNFFMQLAGSDRESLWPAYFLFAAVFASLLELPEASWMVLLIIAVESANLLTTGSFDRSHGHRYVAYPLVLAGISAATTLIVRRFVRQAGKVQDAHNRLIAGADAIDPLADTSNKLESLTRSHRRNAHVKTAIEREIAFNGLLEMIDAFVPAHTYALFLREVRDGSEVSVLSAVQTEDRAAVIPIGTVLDRTVDRTYIDVCADQRQGQKLSDIAGLEIPLSKLGYYRADVRNVPVRSFMVVPVIPKDQDRVVAVLAVDSCETGAFSDEDEDTVTRFSTFFTQIIGKVRQSLELRSKANHFGALHKISEHLNSSLKIEEIMGSVIPMIREAVPFDYGACLLLKESDAGPVLQIAGVHGYPQELVGSGFSLDHSPVITQMHRLWNEQRLQERYSPDLRGKISDVFPLKDMQRPVRTLYGRLLIAQDRMVGAFFLASSDADAFTHYHRTSLFDTLLNQVSMVAYNSLLYQQIENMARTDGLTGLLNHRTFMEKLADEYRRLERDERPFSLLLMDIDKFKGVNDRYGHPVGDLAIKAVARILQEAVRGTDFVARYGGEEFAVGMIDTDARGAEMIAQRIRRSMEQTPVTRTADGELRVTLSIGVVSYPADSRSKTDLVTLADEALYHAKRSGRNRVSLYRDARDSPPDAAPA